MSASTQGLPVLDALLGVKQQRPSWLTIAWRWRYELILTLTITVASVMVWQHAGLLSLAGLCLMLTLSMVTVSRPRRFVMARLWCVLTPHRLRTGCSQARIFTRKGKLPAILWTRAIPAGERVWVWCSAGTYPEQFEQHRENLRAALFARDIRVQRCKRFSHVVTVDVIRRDTLDPKRTITSRLTPTVQWQRSYVLSDLSDMAEPSSQLARIIPGEVVSDDQY
jgi:hypothetical protein